MNCVICGIKKQVKFLNKAKTELNVVIGLCIGQASLFLNIQKHRIQY